MSEEDVPEQPDQPERDQIEVESDPEPTPQVFDVAEQRDEALKAAAAAIRAGECIVLPTDTVYGIGANALDAEAVQRLLDAKQRGRDMPPPVLIADAAALGALVQSVDEDARALADRFWPGPLTLILHAQEGLRMDLGETRGTIAVRVPDHDFTRALLRRTGPLAVSSANVSGQPAATTIDEARDMLGGTVAVYLDAGRTAGNVPSSIVDFTTTTMGVLVRTGALGLEQLQEAARHLEELPVRELEPVDPQTDDPGTDAPGTDDPQTDDPQTDDPQTDDPGTDEEPDHGEKSLLAPEQVGGDDVSTPEAP